MTVLETYDGFGASAHVIAQSGSFPSLSPSQSLSKLSAHAAASVAVLVLS